MHTFQSIYPIHLPFPSQYAPVTYPEDDIICKVDMDGYINFQGCRIRFSKAFFHQPVALRPTDQDGMYHVFFYAQKIAKISLKVDNEC
jgi:hypothetical protein